MILFYMNLICLPTYSRNDHRIRFGRPVILSCKGNFTKISYNHVHFSADFTTHALCYNRTIPDIIPII